MLVLTRKKGQTVFVGDAELTIVSVKGGSIQLGFKAPKNVRIMRGELTDSDPGTNPEHDGVNDSKGEARTTKRVSTAERRAG